MSAENDKGDGLADDLHELVRLLREYVTIADSEMRRLEEKGGTWFAIGNIAEHSGRLHHEAGEWRQEDVVHKFEMILYKGPSHMKAHICLNAFLKCDSVENGTHCFTHNPEPRRGDKGDQS